MATSKSEESISPQRQVQPEKLSGQRKQVAPFRTKHHHIANAKVSGNQSLTIAGANGAEDNESAAATGADGFEDKRKSSRDNAAMRSLLLPKELD